MKFKMASTWTTLGQPSFGISVNNPSSDIACLKDPQCKDVINQSVRYSHSPSVKHSSNLSPRDEQQLVILKNSNYNFDEHMDECRA
ncbi:hypothetical protein HN51_004322 [Arachis hypogaea]